MVRYTLGPQDVDALADQPGPIREHAARNFRRRMFTIAAAFVLLAPIMGFLVNAGGGIALCLYAVLLAFLGSTADRRVVDATRKQYRHLLNHGGFAYLLGDNAMEATPAGLKHFGPTGESLLYWNAIESAVVGGGYVTIRYSTIGVFLIPVAAFPSEAAAQSFVADIHRARLGALHRPIEPAPTVAAPQAVPPVAAPQSGDWWRQGETVVDATKNQRTGG